MPYKIGKQNMALLQDGVSPGASYLVAFKEHVISIVEINDVRSNIEAMHFGGSSASPNTLSTSMSSPSLPTSTMPLNSVNNSQQGGTGGATTGPGASGGGVMEDKWCFELVTYDKRYLLGVSTAKEKNEWIQDLRTVVSEVAQSDFQL